MPYQTDPITIEYMGKWCIFGLRKLIAKCLSGTITVGHCRRFDFYTCQGTKVFVNQSDCARVNRFGWFRLQIKPYQIRALKRAERPKTLEKHEQ